MKEKTNDLIVAQDVQDTELVLQSSENHAEEDKVLFEDTSKRTENVKHFRMKNGSFMAAIYDKPIHYLDEKTGRYCDIPHDFTEEEDRYEAKNHKFKASFPKKAGKRNFLTMEHKGHQVSWRYVPSNSRSKNPEATVTEKKRKGRFDLQDFPALSYVKAESYVDVEYAMTDNGVKENIVIQKAPRKNPPNRFRFAMQFGDLTPRLSEDSRQIDLLAGEEVVLQIPAPNMTDSAGVYSEEGHYELTQETDSSYTMDLVVDEAWMQDKGRVYPVTIAPQVVIPGDNNVPVFTMVSIRSDGSKVSGTAAQHVVGKDKNGVESRLYLKLTNPNAITVPAGCRIKKAVMHLSQRAYENTGDFPGYVVKKIKGDWSAEQLSWENQPAVSDGSVDVIANVYRDPDDPITVDVTNLVQELSAEEEPTGVMIQSQSTFSLRCGTGSTGNNGSCKNESEEEETEENNSSNCGSKEESTDSTPSNCAPDSTPDCEGDDNTTCNTPSGSTCNPSDGNTCNSSGGNSCNSNGGTSGNCNGTCTSQPNNVTVQPSGGSEGESPSLTITYQQMEDYVDNQQYQNFTVGHAGNGYINLFNGALTFVHTDAATHSTKLPMNVSHVYQSMPGKELEKGHYGYGWFLSPDQKVYEYTGKIEGIKAVYRDALGNYHYFVPEYGGEALVAVDQAGTGLRYSETTPKPSDVCWISDFQGNKLHFDEDGNPVYVENSLGNKNTFTYANNLLVCMMDGSYDEEDEKKADRKFDFVYDDNGRLYSFKAFNSTVTDFFYDGNENLRKITYADGETINFAYKANHALEVIMDESGISYCFDYDELGRVKSLLRKGTYAQIKEGETLVKQYTEGETIEFFYGARSTVVTDKLSGRKMVYCFDESGRVTCTYEDIAGDSSLTHGFSTNTIVNEYVNLMNPYGTDNSVYVGRYCSLTSTIHATDKKSKNLLKNGTFAVDDTKTLNPTGWIIGTVDEEKDGVTTDTYDGTLDNLKSYRFNNSDKVSNRYLSQTVNLCNCQIDGNLLLASVWARAYSPVGNTSTGNNYAKFELYAKITYEDGTYNEYTAKFDSGRTDWQYVAAPLLLKQDNHPVQAYVRLDFSNNEGICIFSNARLTSENAIATYYKDFKDEEKKMTILDKQVTICREITQKDKLTTIVEYQDKQYNTVQRDLTDSKGNVFTSYATYPDTTDVTYDSGIFVRTSKARDYRDITTRAETNYTEDGTLKSQSRYTYYLDNEKKHLWDQTTYAISSDMPLVYDDCNGVVNYYWYNEKSGKMDKQEGWNLQTYNYVYHPVNGNMTEVSTQMDGKTIKNSFHYTKGLLTSGEHNGFQYGFTYDGLGRTKSIGIGGKTLANISYTVGSQSTQKVDYENGVCVKVTSDSRGNPLKKTCNGKLVSEATYDELGRPVKVVDKVKNVWYTYDYDVDGNVICKQENDSDNIGFMDTFGYDAGQRLTKRTYGALGHIYNFFYETNKSGEIYPDNALVTIQLVGRFTDKIAKDTLGRPFVRTLQKSNGKVLIEQQYNYVEISSDESYTFHRKFVESVDRTVYGTTNTVSSLQYGYDGAGNIKTISKNNDLHVRYFYDKLNRLVQEDNYVVNRSYYWNYDKGGNITSKIECELSTNDNQCSVLHTYGYIYNGTGWKDQLKSYNGTSFVYDAIGNPTTYKNHNLTWENVRQLKKYGDNEFWYGADGIRYKKNDTVYTLDGSRILQETDGTKTITYYYGNDGVIGFNYDAKDYYYEKNLQGDITAIYDTNGVKQAEYVYDAWGKLLFMENSNDNNIGDINPFRYRSYYYDVETRLYYLGSRYYDPEICRFINPDSIDHLNPTAIGGLNLYSYANNNSVSTKYGISQIDIGVVDKISVLPPILEWFEPITMTIDIASSLSGAFQTSVWGLTQEGKAFLEFYYSAYSNNHFAILNELSSSFGRMCQKISIGLIVADLVSNVYDSMQKKYSFEQGAARIALTGAKDLAIYFISAKVVSVAGSYLAAKMGGTIGTAAGPVGMFVGTVIGIVVGAAIDDIGNYIIDWVMGLFD